MSGSVIEAADC